MRTWKPASWSQQAREMCDKQIEYINGGHAFIEDALHLFSNSYRAPIIRDRAAKRFGRLMRAGKVKENVGGVHQELSPRCKGKRFNLKGRKKIMNERMKVWLVEFSNGERVARVGKYEAWKSGAEYIKDTYDTLIAEAAAEHDMEAVRSLTIEGLKALTEFKAASARQGNFECDCLVRVTELEVY